MKYQEIPNMDVRQPLYQAIASILIGVMLFDPRMVWAAGLALDPAAAGNASLGQAANGVPLVNINKPSASGLSHNKFTDYNVGSEGLILNNSAKALTSTQLGGQIPGNANLKGGQASLILNEVTGGNASRLDGYTEVAGKSAHVVVANPHGITCDGCGFINTPKATLTTGSPQLENGALKAYDVNQGRISIEGAGLNASNVDQFELITRAAEINAKVYAQELAIVAGRNEVDARTLQATAKAADASAKPSVAIDSSALGGMYAGAIRLVGTEAGVGVKLDGDLAATAGDILIDANGQLKLARSATAGDLEIRAQDVTLAGDIYAVKDARIETGSLEVQEGLAAGQQVQITAQTLSNAGSIDAGVRVDGSINSAAELQIGVGTVENAGSLRSYGTLKANVQRIANDGDIVAAGDTQITADILTNNGQIIVQRNLEIAATRTRNTGTLGAAGSLRVESSELTNEQGLLFSGADMKLRGEHLTNRLGDVLSLGDLDIAADDQGGRTAILENVSGTIESGGDMRLAADQLINRKDRFQAEQQRVSGKITLLKTDHCAGEHCEAGYLLEERYEPVVAEDSPAPMLVAGGDLSFSGERFDNRLGSVSAGGDIQIDGDQFLNIGAGGGRERSGHYYIYESNDAIYAKFLRDLARYNAYNDPDSPEYDPAAMTFESIAIGLQRNGGWVNTSGEALVNAVVQAGGAVTINASQMLENGVIRPDGSGAAHLNRQLPPDLATRLVDPLELPGYGLPSGSGGLFRLSVAPGNRYLIESNPAFANLASFLSSDYMLDLLGYSDEGTLRRLGDGLYEQRLIREAIIASTGKRFLGDFLASDEAQFRQLMDNGISSKEALNLSVGVALSAEQIAALTHEIVWMEEKEVAGERVLVPVLYLPHAPDRLAPTGALIEGVDLLLSAGGLSNQGTLRGGTIDLAAMAIDNRGLVQSDTRLSVLGLLEVHNQQGGILAGDTVEIASLGNLLNERNVISNHGRDGGFSWRDDVVDNAARIEAGNSLVIDVAGDLRNAGGVIQSAGDAYLMAGRDIRLDAVSETDGSRMLFNNSLRSSDKMTQHGSEIEVTGNLGAWAGRDLSVQASQIKAGGDIGLYAGHDLSVSAAANQSSSQFFRKSSGKQLHASSKQVEQQGAALEAAGRVELMAGNDLAVVGSRVRADGDVAMESGRDITIAAATDQSESAYQLRRSGSLGRKSSRSGEKAASQAVASQIQSGGSISINTVVSAEGELQLTGGRDLRIEGSQLQAGQDITLGTLGDIAISSRAEERTSSAQSSKSSLLGKRSNKRLKSEVLQVVSELNADRDLLVVAGNDLKVRASSLTAGQDAELYAGVLTGTGNIELSAAEERDQEYRSEQSKRTGLSGGNMIASVSSAKSLGGADSSTTQVGSQVLAGRDAILRSAQDVTVKASVIGAGRDVFIGANRDVQILSSDEPYWSRFWKSDRKTGIDLQSDGNGFTAFMGSAREKTELLNSGHAVIPSEIGAGRDLLVDAGRDYLQEGSDLGAGQDIILRAERDMQIRAAMEREASRFETSLARNGLTSNLNHNFDSTLDTIGNTGRGEDATSQVSSVFKTVDTVSQFLAGPTVGDHIGSTSNKNAFYKETVKARPSVLKAERDIDARAGEHLSINGSQLGAGRDIVLAGRDVTLDVARGQQILTQQQTISQGGINAGATANSARIGVGGSQGSITDEQISGNFTPTVLVAKQDIMLTAEHDLTLAGVRASAERNINLEAGRDLSVGAAGIDATVDNRRRSGGGEVGIALGGSDFIAVYVSADVGRGDLDRKAQRQEESVLQAGERISFSSGQDTAIKGAQLGANEIVGRVGRNLTVSSVPDTGKVEGEQLDASVTVSIGWGTGSVSGSVGRGKTTGKTNWVQEQTTLHAEDLLDIHVGEHTQVDGALIYSDTGNLKLDTNTLGFRDIKGEDREHSWYINVGGSMSFGDSGNSGGSGGTDGASAAANSVVTDRSQQGKGSDGASGWSLSGYDHKRERSQLVRATIGDGQIIVRDDAVTGKDSLAGLNRDPSRSQINLTDKSRNTDLYVSSSAIERVSNPGETFDQWAADLPNFFKAPTKAYANYELLAKQSQREANRRPYLRSFSVLAENFVKISNKVNAWSLHAMPGVEKRGGIFSQLFAFYKDDMFPARVHTELRIKDGAVVFESGKPVVVGEKSWWAAFDGFGESEHVFINGIANSLEEAIVNGAMQTGSKDYIVLYNVSRGFWADMLESIVDKIFGGYLTSGASRAVTEFRKEALAADAILKFATHSQGSLLWDRSSEELARLGITELGTVQSSGGPINAIHFHDVSQNLGYSEDRRLFQVNREDGFGGVATKTDSVSDLLGFNFRYGGSGAKNLLGSILSIPWLLMESSQHSNYGCLICGGEISDQGSLINSGIKKPVVIDSSGKARQ
jgi:filamentous hemagglutinin